MKRKKRLDRFAPKRMNQVASFPLRPLSIFRFIFLAFFAIFVSITAFLYAKKFIKGNFFSITTTQTSEEANPRHQKAHSSQDETVIELE